MSSGSRGGSVTPTYVPGNRLAAAADPYLPTQNAPMLPHPTRHKTQTLSALPPCPTTGRGATWEVGRRARLDLSAVSAPTHLHAEATRWPRPRSF